MIDRYGHRIAVGWPEHHLEWIRAALTLDMKAKKAAFHDIAEMTGRGFKAVRARAYCINALDRRHAAAHLRRTVMRLPTAWSLPPSELRQPTKQQLMGCR